MTSQRRLVSPHDLVQVMQFPNCLTETLDKRPNLYIGCHLASCPRCGEMKVADKKKWLEENGLPTHFVEAVWSRLNQPSFHPIAPNVPKAHKEHTDTFNTTMDVYKHLQNYFKMGHVAIIGGYPAYLEGLTSDYNDIDIFINFPIIHHDTLKNRLTNCKVMFERFKPFQCIFHQKYWLWYPSGLNFLGVAYVQIQNVSFNLIFKGLPSDIKTWTETCMSITHKFDRNVCAVALSEDGKNLVRFSPDKSFRTRPEVAEDTYIPTDPRRIVWRERKYNSRKIHNGSPASLLHLAWTALPN